MIIRGWDNNEEENCLEVLTKQNQKNYFGFSRL